jgi:cytochrome P450
MFEGSIKDPEGQKRAGKEFEEYLDGLVEERKDKRGDDFISLLLETEVEGHKLTDLEIRGFGVVMLMAGHETTAGAMSMTTKFLAGEHGIRERLFAEPSLIPSAVNEFLRLFPSIQVFCRNAAQDLELHGERVAEGEVVALAYAAANRDPREFPDPDACVLDRKPNKHVTFGYGHHLCLGANVARLEMAVMLAELARLMPSFSLDPAQPPVWRARGDVRGLLSLPLVIDG